ncbi:unnamed protein product [Gadus morhua 'NCC']
MGQMGVFLIITHCCQDTQMLSLLGGEVYVLLSRPPSTVESLLSMEKMEIFRTNPLQGNSGRKHEDVTSAFSNTQRIYSTPSTANCHRGVLQHGGGTTKTAWMSSFTPSALNDFCHVELIWNVQF